MVIGGPREKLCSLSCSSFLSLFIFFTLPLFLSRHQRPTLFSLELALCALHKETHFTVQLTNSRSSVCAHPAFDWIHEFRRRQKTGTTRTSISYVNPCNSQGRRGTALFEQRRKEKRTETRPRVKVIFTFLRNFESVEFMS